MTEREVFLNHLAEASGRARHQLVDHPLRRSMRCLPPPSAIYPLTNC